MKKMVHKLVYEVRSETGKPRMAATYEAKPKSTPKTKAKKVSAQTELLGSKCPKCLKGNILKGKNAYGCNQWNQGCNFRLPFVFLDKKLSKIQLQRLIEKQETTKLKGFLLNGKKVDGHLKLNSSFEIEFEQANALASPKESSMPPCPKCGLGTIIKGKSAYGCSRWKSGCNFRFTFEEIRTRAKGQNLTKELVLSIMRG